MDEYLYKYLPAPSTYKGSSKPSARTPERGREARSDPKPASEKTSTNGRYEEHRLDEPEKLIEYPFPLRCGQMAFLHLPRELPRNEAERLCGFLNSLAMDQPPALTAGEQASHG